MPRTLTAMYDSRSAADAARDELVGLGVPSADIVVRGAESGTSGGTATEDKGFWESLKDFFVPDEDRSTYAEGMRRGSYLLTARVPDDMEDRAIEALERSGAVDVDERAESWRQSGWTGYQAGQTSAGASTATAASYGEGSGLTEGRTDYETGRSTDAGSTFAGYGAGTGSTGTGADYEAGRSTSAGTTGTAYGEGTGTTTTGSAGSDYAAGERSANLRGGGLGAGTRGTEGEEKLQVTEEQLDIGKRETGRGRVRVRSYVTERPVEEQVNLRQERVEVERRPVDREISPDEAPFQERTIEATERGEEAVVDKTARVVEEVGVRKDVETETETVRDTVRKQDVEVEDERSGSGLSGGRDRRDPDAR